MSQEQDEKIRRAKEQKGKENEIKPKIQIKINEIKISDKTTV